MAPDRTDRTRIILPQACRRLRAPAQVRPLTRRHQPCPMGTNLTSCQMERRTRPTNYTPRRPPRHRLRRERLAILSRLRTPRTPRTHRWAAPRRREAGNTRPHRFWRRYSPCRKSRRSAPNRHIIIIMLRRPRRIYPNNNTALLVHTRTRRRGIRRK